MRASFLTMDLLVASVLVASCSTPTPPTDPVPTEAGLPAGSPSYPAFDRALFLETTSETSANVSAGDLDGDGHLDLVLAKGRHWPLVNRVLLGDGKGAFPTAFDLAEVADRTYSGRLADLDGDGDLDVVISNDKPDPKRTYLNDGKGGFEAGSTYGDPEWKTRNAAVADLDGDGRPDIVVANRANPGANYVCLNDGGGGFGAECILFSQEPSTTITPADFNGNGLVDLAVPFRDGGQSYVYLNGGGATFPEEGRIPFGPSDAGFRMAVAADFDGDGSLDLAAIDERRGVFAYFGRNGSFSEGLAVEQGEAPPYALAAGDLDGDGKVDLVVGHVEAKPTVHFNDGSGRRYTAVPFGDAEGAAYGFALADLDGDGLVDIAMARSDAPNVVYFARKP